MALTWWALWITTKPAHSGKTYGYHRAGILVALVNSTTLALIALGIFYQGWKRLVSPPEVRADLLIWVGASAIVVNLVTALLVRHGAEHDLNLKSAFLHLMGDVLSTVGAVIAGIVIYFTGWNWLDALISVLIGLLILWNAWGILRESLDILMEATPMDIDMEESAEGYPCRSGSAWSSRSACLEHHSRSADLIGSPDHRGYFDRPGGKSSIRSGGDARQKIRH